MPRVRVQSGQCGAVSTCDVGCVETIEKKKHITTAAHTAYIRPYTVYTPRNGDKRKMLLFDPTGAVVINIATHSVCTSGFEYLMNSFRGTCPGIRKK